VVETWVVNASPLIALDRIGRLGILSRLGAEVVITGGVLTEITRGPKSIDLSQLGPHRRVTVADTNRLVAAWDLGVGESEVLTWAVASTGAIAVLDDRAAHHCAMTLGVPTFGTLRVILRAKKLGLVPSAAHELEALRAAGLFLSPAVVAAALRLAGETS
jgi:predicted nucleic acid-binding protein